MVLSGIYTYYTRANIMYSNLCLCSHINSVRTMDVSVYYGEIPGNQERHSSLPCNEQRTISPCDLPSGSSLNWLMLSTQFSQVLAK